ncbi:MAG TPA: CotS family spore coat protein, partial [Bacilli bacterium]|nr:CotS family spore coat protein [Bacilli bacterium]
MGKKKDERDLLEAFDGIGGDPEVLREWDLPIDKVKKVRGVLKIRTAVGNRMLKRLTVSEERLQFIQAVTDHLAANGFTQVPRFIRTKYGDPYVVHETGLYYLTEWFSGKEADLKKPKNVFLAAETLARFHLAGQEFASRIEQPDTREDFGTIWGTYRAKLESYDHNIEDRRELTVMDTSFREHREDLEKMIKHAQHQLEESPYEEILDWAEEHKTICHGSYSRQNLIVDKDKMAVVDFDHCHYGHPVHDIGGMLTRYMPRYDWDPEVGISILDMYRSVREISAEEMTVLAAYLTFPTRTFQVVESYFERTKEWEVDRFASRFKKALKLDSAREAFVQELITRYGLEMAAPDFAPQIEGVEDYADIDESSSV